MECALRVAMAPKTRSAGKAALPPVVTSPLLKTDAVTPSKPTGVKKARTAPVVENTSTATQADPSTPAKNTTSRKRSKVDSAEADSTAVANTSASQDSVAKRGKVEAPATKDPKQRTLCFGAARTAPAQIEHAPIEQAVAKPVNKEEEKAQVHAAPTVATRTSPRKRKPTADAIAADTVDTTTSLSSRTEALDTISPPTVDTTPLPSSQTQTYDFAIGESSYFCTCTSDPEVADTWATHVAQDVEARAGDAGGAAGIIGLDCEWAAPWHRAAGVPDRLATLQLFYHGSAGRGALVFSVAGLGGKLPPKLMELLSTDRIAKLGVNVAGDATRVVRDFGCPVKGLYDLSGLNKQAGTKVKKSISLEDVVRKHCPEDMHISKSDAVLSKGVRTSNWEAWPLTAEQVEYAAKDAALGVQAFIHRFEMADGTQLSKGASDALVTLEEPCAPDAAKQEALAVANLEKAAEDPGNKPNFFIAMRNSALKAPNIGNKAHPDGSKDALKKVNIVVSGILDSFERKDFEQYVIKHGGIVSKGITGKVTHLVSDHGEAGPSKVAKCKELGIPMVSEDVILQLVSASKP